MAQIAACIQFKLKVKKYNSKIAAKFIQISYRCISVINLERKRGTTSQQDIKIMGQTCSNISTWKHISHFKVLKNSNLFKHT